MAPIVQFAFVLALAAAPALLVAMVLQQLPRALRRGGDPVAFPLRRRVG